MENSFKNNAVVNKLKANPFKFFNSFSKGAHCLPCAAKFKKHYLSHREELSEIFLELLRHSFNVPTEWIRQISWWNRPFTSGHIYGYWNPETRSIHINSHLITNPRIALNLIFREFTHALHDYRVAAGCNFDKRHPRDDPDHDNYFEQCFREVTGRFVDLPIERNDVLWADL